MTDFQLGYDEKYNSLPRLLDINPLSTDDMIAFEEIRCVLERHGCLERFGLTLLHKHFDLQCDEILVESTDSESRQMTIEAVKLAEVDTSETVQTMWRFDGSSKSAMTSCTCYNTCKASSEGADHPPINKHKYRR